MFYAAMLGPQPDLIPATEIRVPEAKRGLRWSRLKRRPGTCSQYLLGAIRLGWLYIVLVLACFC